MFEYCLHNLWSKQTMSPSRLQLVSCPSGFVYLSVYLRSLLDCGSMLPGNRLGSDIGSLSLSILALFLG